MVAETAVDQRNRHSAAIFRPAQVNNHILEHQFHGLTSSQRFFKKISTIKNLSVRSPLYKNLFSLKFETGSCFLKCLKTLCKRKGQIGLVNIQDPLWRHKCLITPSGNAMIYRFSLRNELNAIKYSYPQCIFSSWCTNLFRLTWENAGC